MSASEWPRVKALFHAALECPPSQRPAFLVDACNGDEALITEVTRLLEAHAQSGQFLEHSPVSLSGRRIGHYDVGRLIGAGGMGEVYAARDTDLGREVALKIASRVNADAQARLRREAQHASRLNHPNICTVHEIGTESGQSYIVMEYVGGRLASDLITERGVYIETVLRYGIQIASALAHAHEHGVVHRDLKSSNVVITPDGRVKVLDFGLSRRLAMQDVPHTSGDTLLTADGVVAGTPAYMAPELLRGAAADARSDIWALGVLLYELANGHRPFHGDTGFALSAAILHEPIPPMPDRVPTSLQTVIRRCLAKDPHERYQQAIEVRSALEMVLSEVSAATGESERPPQRLVAGRALPSRRALIACGAGLLATAIALAIALMWRSGTSSVPVAIGTSGRPVIAVMNFEIADRDQRDEIAWLSKGLSSMLVTGLAQMRGLDIVSGQRLREVGAEMGDANLDALDRRRAADVAKRAGAGAIVVGSIFKSGSEIRIDARLEDLTSGRVLAAESVRGTDPFTLADQLATKIRDGIGLGKDIDLRKIAEISSASLEAYRLYSDGMDAYFNARWPDAQKLLEQAVAVDPEFTQAYLSLASVCQWAGRPAAAEKYLRQAAAHTDRLSERERLFVRAELARVEGRSAEAGRLLDELVARFPDFDNVYSIATQLYSPLAGTLDAPDKFVSIAEAGVKKLPRSGHMRNTYAYALMATGRFADAGRELDTYAQLVPREPNPYDSLGELNLLLGNPARSVEFYSRALTVDPTFPSRSGRSWALAMLGRYDEAIADHGPGADVSAFVLSRVGRYREAARDIEAGMTDADAGGSVVIRTDLHLLSSVFAIEQKDYARARMEIAVAEQIVAALPEEQRRLHLVAADLLAGIADARTGLLAKARLHLDSLTRRHRSSGGTEISWRKALEAEIALAEHQPGRAATVYAYEKRGTKNQFSVGGDLGVLAASLPFRDGLARAKQAQGDPAGAMAIYRSLLTPGPQQEWTALLEPRFVLEIARLLEQVGDKAGARQEYARFLDLWKHADAELPELTDARRALERLRSQS